MPDPYITEMAPHLNNLGEPSTVCHLEEEKIALATNNFIYTAINNFMRKKNLCVSQHASTFIG